MSRYDAPTKPVILYPTGSEEVSNLNPIMTAVWEKSTDVYYSEYTGTADGLKFTDTPPYHYFYPQQFDDGSTIRMYVDTDVMGRFAKIKLFFCVPEYIGEPGGRAGTDGWVATPVKIGPTDVYGKLYHATKDENGITKGDLVHGGYLDEDGYLNVPYEKVQDLNNGLVLECTKYSGDFRVEQGMDSLWPDYAYLLSHIDRINEDGSLHTENSTTRPRVELQIFAGHQKDIYYDVQFTPDGSTWEYLAQFIPDIDRWEHDFSNEIAALEKGYTYTAKVRVRANDTNHYYLQASSGENLIFREPNRSEWAESQAFALIRHTNPDKPTNLTISETNIIDKNVVNRLKWKHNHNDINNRQGKALIKWRLQGTTPWNEITVEGMNQFYDIPALTFPIGIIELTVQTWSYVLMESPVSDIYVFEAKETPAAPTLASPTGTVEVTSPYVVWEHPDIQTHYQVRALDMSDNVLWDTGQVAGNITSKKIEFYLDNLSTFKAQARIKNSQGLWSSWGISIFNTNYKYPAPAVVSAVANDGYITVTYQNGSPVGEQPFTDRNEVYKQVDGEWVLIADGYTHTFNDYSAPNDVEVKYFVRSYAANGAWTDSEIVSAKIKLRGVVLYLVNDPEGTRHVFKLDGHGRDDDWEVESVLRHFRGRARPTIEIGEMETDVINFTLMLENDEEMQALERIVKSKQMVCYRDGRGRSGYGVFTRRPLADERWGGYSTTLSITKLDYIEKV